MRILFTGLFAPALTARTAWWGHESWASTDLADLAQACDVYLFLQQGGWVVSARRAWGGRSCENAVPVSSESAKRAFGRQ